MYPRMKNAESVIVFIGERELRKKLARRWGPTTVRNAIQRIRVVFKFAMDNGLTERFIRGAFHSLWTGVQTPFAKDPLAGTRSEGAEAVHTSGNSPAAQRRLCAG
jgi:hypothetical protein